MSVLSLPMSWTETNVVFFLQVNDVVATIDTRNLRAPIL